MILKGIVSEADWPAISNQLNFNFAIDNHFEEFKEAEIITNRVNTLNMIQPYIGKYYSDMWIRKNILKQTDEEIMEMMQEMAEEMPPPEMMVPQQEVDQGFDAMQQQSQNSPMPDKPKPVQKKTNIPGKGSAH